MTSASADRSSVCSAMVYKRARRPSAVAVAAQVHGVDVEVFAQRARHPVPHAGVVQAAVNQDERGFAVLPPIPELKFQAMRVVVVRDGFQFLLL